MTAKFRVLVIDDEAAILRFLKPALEANSYDMSSAGTVAEGSQMHRRRHTGYCAA